MNKWLGAMVAVLLAAAGGGWHLSAQVNKTEQRVETVEARQKEDRDDTRRDLREVKRDVKKIDENVQQILLKLESMQAQKGRR